MLLTFPNQLTLLRMVFVPVFIMALIYDQEGWALLVFVLAGITDALDGLLARVLDQKTTLGAFLDPMADKLLITAAFVLLSIPSVNPANTIPLWLTILVISRDVIISLSALFIHMSYGRRKFPPSRLGKTATLVDIGAVFVVLWLNYRGLQPAAIQWVFLITLAITLLSGFHYLSILPRLARGDE
ncbi:MAG: CDP-alcohol phosphatidyltransferase family protein [Acidobacteriota bacterium]